MKLNKLFIGAIAALASAAMVACSDDAPDTPGGETIGKDGGYIAVNIMAPSGNGSRADNTFEAGTEKENDVKSVTFFTFKADKTQFQKYQRTVTPDVESTETPGTDINVEKILTAILVINGQDAGTPLPDQLITVLNISEAQAEALSNLNLDQFRTKIDNYASTGSFIMTNSVYLNEAGEEVCGTKITEAYSSIEVAEATGNALDVYVERVVAKVTVEYDATLAITDNTITQSIKVYEPANDGTMTEKTVTLSSEITGISLTNTINKSYLFKNITGNGNWTWNGWNDYNNSRSYWAVSATGEDIDYDQPSWNEIVNKISTDNKTLNYYIQENTNQNQLTAVIAAVQHKVDGTPYNMIQWAGKIYEATTFTTLMANVLNANGYLKDGNRFTAADLDMVVTPTDGFEAYETCCQLATPIDGTTFTQNGTVVSADGVNGFLKEKLNRAQYWKDGKAYYYVDINHHGPTTPYNKGIVRNHVYKLNITGIEGPGVPVINPDKPIDPENPDDKNQTMFLKAKINILSWKVVSQEVNFGKK